MFRCAKHEVNSIVQLQWSADELPRLLGQWFAQNQCITIMQTVEVCDAKSGGRSSGLNWWTLGNNRYSLAANAIQSYGTTRCHWNLHYLWRFKVRLWLHQPIHEIA